jgi:type IV secretion system protein VirB4
LQGVVCELDLEGFDAELAVISGRARNVQRVSALIEELGEAPESWLPTFRAQFESQPRGSA